MVELVARAVVDAAGPFGHRSGEEHDERDHALAADRGWCARDGLDPVEDGGEVPGGGGVGFDAPCREATAELGDDPQVRPAGGVAEQCGVGDDEAADEGGERRGGAGFGEQPAPFGVDGSPAAGQDLPEETLARAEVVGDRRGVALLGGLGDLAGGDALDAADGEQPLGLVEDAVAGGGGDGCRGLSSPGGAARWWGSR